MTGSADSAEGSESAAESPEAAEGTESVAERPESASERDASGSRSVLLASVRNAILHGESWLFRSYGVVGTFVATFVGLLVLLAFPTWADLTEDAGTLQRVGRAFLVLAGLALVVPVVLPLVLVERRRRAGRPLRQRAFALAGYAYVGTLYLAALVSAPPGLREEPGGALAPLVEALYALPPVAAGAFLLAGVAAVVAVETDVGRAATPD